MHKKFNDVQHFKLKPSRALYYFQQGLYTLAFLLILFCSLEYFFKVLLILLLGLEYRRQKTLNHNKNHLTAIEIRDNKVFLKRKNDDEFQAITQISMKENRIFAELKFYLKDEVLFEFFYQDSFFSKKHFSLLMQNLRFNNL